MTPLEDRVRVASRISKELDARVRSFYVTSSSAIPDALELIAARRESELTPPDASSTTTDVNRLLTQVDALTTRVNDLLASNEL